MKIISRAGRTPKRNRKPKEVLTPFDVKVIGEEFSGKRPHHVVNPEVLEGSA